MNSLDLLKVLIGQKGVDISKTRIGTSNVPARKTIKVEVLKCVSQADEHFLYATFHVDVLIR